MKKLLLILGFMLLGYSVFGQLLVGSTIEYFTVGSDTYLFECAPHTMHIANRNNNKEDSTFYYKDGRRAEGTWDDVVPGDLRVEDFYRALGETFTASEIESLKSSRALLDIYCIFDDKGRMLECGFLLPMTPIVQALPKVRFATLEQKLKQYITMNITDEYTKKLKYVFGGMQTCLWKQ